MIRFYTDALIQGLRRMGPVLVVLLAVTLAGCSAGTRTPSSVAVPGLPHTDTPASTQATDSAYPPPFTGTFWWPDSPKELKPKAFGKVSSVKNPILRDSKGEVQGFEIGKFTLDTTLPQAATELPVYMIGVYPSSHRQQFKGPDGWTYKPLLAAVLSGPIRIESPVGDKAAEQATAFLKQYDLLLPDNEAATVYTRPEATILAFYRHAAGLPVYGDPPACVTFGKDGTGSAMLRRRPFLERSMYPIRTPQEAWQSLQRREFVTPSGTYCDDGGPVLLGKVADFRVTSVELAYWESQVLAPLEAMLPYYIFRNADGASLYVPAVAPEWLADDKSAGTQ